MLEQQPRFKMPLQLIMMQPPVAVLLLVIIKASLQQQLPIPVLQLTVITAFATSIQPLISFRQM